MNTLQETKSQTVYQCWSQTVAGVLAWPWELFEAQYQVGLKIVEVALRIPGGSRAKTGTGPLNSQGPVPVFAPGADERSDVAPRTATDFQRLESLAFERARKGLAPPSEIYGVPYRDRIDWSKFPDWARPIDPEVFQDCGHEG